jgi:hypothetical protein
MLGEMVEVTGHKTAGYIPVDYTRASPGYTEGCIPEGYRQV